MKDRLGRRIHYMRISITDRCNLRCSYCMPKGVPAASQAGLLRYEEIERLGSIGASLGIDTLRITGGEPLVRKDAFRLVERLKKIQGIKQVSMTTNGVALAKEAERLAAAGLDSINISLDAADRMQVAKICGRDCYEQVLAGIDAARNAGLQTKLNTVLTAQSQQQQWEKLLQLAAEKELSIRFIELMPIGYGKQLLPMDNRSLKRQIMEKYPQSYEEGKEAVSIYGAGPASYIRIPELSINVGFISAIHGKFCKDCNRIRLTSQGFLKPCLCYGAGVDLKTPLRRGRLEEVALQMQRAIYEKPEGHCFEQPEHMTEKKEMVRIGG